LENTDKILDNVYYITKTTGLYGPDKDLFVCEFPCDIVPCLIAGETHIVFSFITGLFNTTLGEKYAIWKLKQEYLMMTAKEYIKYTNIL